jgi:hypothetical protein
MSDEDRRRKLWEEDYGSEEEFLHAWGFSRERHLRDLGEDLWRYGSSRSAKAGEIEEANVYTRQQAFNKIAEWMDRND